MESGKQGGASSETSSDGSEQVNHDRTATKRSYECTYCKRGFTNAQALGGHMNIHRKDRAKAKQPSVQYNPVTSNNLNYHKNSNNHIIDHEFLTSNNSNNFTAPSFSPLSSHHHVTSWYVKPVDHDHDHRSVYFQPGPSIPSTLPFGYPNYETTPNHASLAISNEELMGADLSLQIDCDDHESVSRGLVNEDVLDLELRLGYR